MTDLEIVQNITQNFFEKMGVEIESLEIKEDDENIYSIQIQTPDSSLLIGFSGKNLDDIRIILKLLASKKIGKPAILHIEINDYILKKDDKLYQFIAKKINIVESTGKDIALPFFNAYERKKIHNYVGENKNDDIYTKSVGEGKERRLYICKKTESLSIDMDGVGI